MSATLVAVQPGDVIAEKYRIEAEIGRGGLGVVYRAVDLGVGRDVALKMMLPHALANDESRARFRREAELAKRLSHPNTVRLYDVGETAAGAPFIVWEHLVGRSLDALLAEEGALSPERVAHLASHALKSLMEAHGFGIVHRDIKPSNLFLCAFPGEPDFLKVLDFGIAKAAADASGITQEGSIGTPAYMSPEQVRGGALTPASDLYSLALVLAELLSGKPVFDGASPYALATAQLSSEPAPLAEGVLASPLGRVLAKATSKDPRARYATAAEMLAAIEAAIPHATRTGAQPIAPMPAPRSNAALFGMAAGAGALVIAAVVVLAFGLRRDARRDARPHELRGRSAATAPSTHEPLAPLPLASLTDEVLTDRLKRLGFTIVNEVPTHQSNYRYTLITVLRAGQSVGVQLIVYRDELTARAGDRFLPAARVREGMIVLAATPPDAGRQVLVELGYHP